MRNRFGFVVLSMVFLVLVTMSVLAQMPPDGIYFVRPEASERETLDFRPEYITDEVLVFYSCIEGASKVFNSVYCKDDPTKIYELNTYPWKDGCFISSFELNSSVCSEMITMAEYEYKDEILKWTEEIVVKDVDSIPRTILDSQSSEGGWDDPVSTAWVLWALSEFDKEGQTGNNTYSNQIEAALRWLKENRNSEYKCWPEENCSISITAEVLALLTEANFDDRRDVLRIIHDANIWLSLQQNLFDLRDPTESDTTNKKWKVQLTGVNWTNGTVNANYSSCLIDYAEELDMSLQVEFDRTYDIEFTPIHDEYLDIICTPNSLPLAIRNDGNEVLFNSTTANVSYHIPGACWDDVESWNFCDVPTTNFGAGTTIGEIRTGLAKDWLVDTLIENDIGKVFNTSDKIFDTSWLLYKRYASNSNDELSENEEKIVRWLLYHQNNAGFWGNTSEIEEENIAKTAMASIALTRINNGTYTEFIKDANIWISQNTPDDGWDTIKKDAISFLAFSRSAKPFVWLDDGMIIMKSNDMEIELYNPSSYDFNNLEFKLQGNISDVLEIEEIGSLASDYYKKIDLSLKENVDSSMYGYLLIEDDSYEIAEIPILIQSIPELTFKQNKPFVSVYDGKGSVTFNIEKTTSDVLECDLTWNDPTITSKKKFKIDKQKSITTDVVFSEIKNQDVDYKGSFNCLYNGVNITEPLILSTKQFEGIPFSVIPGELNMTSHDQELSITIYNNVDKKITLNVAFETEDPYFSINNPVINLEPLAEKIVTLQSFMPANESVVWDNTLVVSGYDRSENVFLSVNLGAKKASSFISTIIFFIVILGVFAGLAVTAFIFRSQILSYLPANIRSKLPEELFVGNISSSPSSSGFHMPFGKGKSDDENVHPLEKKISAKNFVHIAELIKIMKGLGQDDDSISKRLEAEGYSKGEIHETFKRVSDEMDQELSLEKEDKFMKLMKTLDQDAGSVRAKLKQDGFTDQEIREAFKQAEDEIQKKRKVIAEKIKNKSKYDITPEDAAKSLEDEGK